MNFRLTFSAHTNEKKGQRIPTERETLLPTSKGLGAIDQNKFRLFQQREFDADAGRWIFFLEGLFRNGRATALTLTKL
jgi:hypothetical protein